MKASTTTTEKTIASSTLIVPRPRSEMLERTHRFIHFLLAPITLQLLLLLPLGFVLYQVAVHFEAPLKGLLLHYAPLLILSLGAALALRFGARLRAGADQIFFSETQQREKLLRSLLEQIPTCTELSEVIYHTCQTLNEAYQATPIHLFFRATRELKLVYSYGGTTEVLLIPEKARLRSILKREGGAVEYPFADGLQLPAVEQSWLEQLQARVLVPVTGKDRRVLGLITLGEKRFVQSYSAHDCALLNAIGEQIARRLEREEIRLQMNQQSKVPLATLARLEAEMTKPQAPESTVEEEALTPDNYANHETANASEEKPSWI